MAVAYFPTLYEDELIYSVLARFYVHTGYPTYTYAAQDLYLNYREPPMAEFINKLKPEIVDLLCKDMSLEKLLEKHTMFNYYARFMLKDRRKQVYKALCDMSGNFDNLLSVPKQKTGETRYLRYCPLCVGSDREQFGETYWHRVHQLKGVNVCSIHGCRLLDSSVSMHKKVSPNLVTAEQEIKEEMKHITFGNEMELKLARYVAEVFQKKLDMESNVSIGEFLHSRMEGTIYLSVRGEQRNIAALCMDLKKYYEEFPRENILERWKIEKVLAGNRIYTYDVCQIAMFLGISADELANRKLPQKSQVQIFDEKIKELHEQGLKYPEIARKLNASYEVVKMIGRGRYAKKNGCIKQCREEEKQKGGVKPMDWNKVDEETLPLVKQVIKTLQGQDGERPQRITCSAISRILNLPSGRLDALVKCREEISKHTEPIEQYWARELVWAIRYLESSGKIINWKQVRILTNMRKKNVAECFTYLKQISEPEIIEVVEDFLQTGV